MGLNLNIRRIIFHTTEKVLDGAQKGKGKVEASMMKQIAGRAGRRSSKFDQGLATCLMESDMPWLKHAVEAPVEQVERAGLFPAVEHLQHFSDVLDTLDALEPGTTEVGSRELAVLPPVQHSPRKLSETLSLFFKTASLVEDGSYFVCRHDEMSSLSNRLHDTLGMMPLTDGFTFCMAPVKTSDRLSFTMLVAFADAWAHGKPTSLNVRFPSAAPTNVIELSELCVKHNIVDLYLWLSNRFPGNFVERELALVQKAHAIGLIQQGLENLDLDLDDIENLSFRRRLAPGAMRGAKGAAPAPRQGPRRKNARYGVR